MQQWWCRNTSIAAFFPKHDLVPTVIIFPFRRNDCSQRGVHVIACAQGASAHCMRVPAELGSPFARRTSCPRGVGGTEEGAQRASSLRVFTPGALIAAMAAGPETEAATAGAGGVEHTSKPVPERDQRSRLGSGDSHAPETASKRSRDGQAPEPAAEGLGSGQAPEPAAEGLGSERFGREAGAHEAEGDLIVIDDDDFVSRVRAAGARFRRRWGCLGAVAPCQSRWRCLGGDGRKTE